MNSVRRIAVLIGGGVPGRTVSRLWKPKQLPEMAEYHDIKKSYKLFRSLGLSKDNIYVHFGAKDQQGVYNFPSYFSYIVNHELSLRESGKSSKQMIETVDPITDSAMGCTVDEITATFDKIVRISKEEEIELAIVGSSHGISYRGLLLQNSYLTWNTLSVPYLRKQIEKLDKKTKVKLLMDSCYSGQYLELTSSNTAVLTSSNYSKPSYYKIGVGSKRLAELVKNTFSDSKSRTSLVKASCFSGSSTENYNATDSLVHYIDKILARQAGLERWHKCRTQLIKFGSLPQVHYTMSVGILGIIIYDPTGIVHKYYSMKLAYVFGKTTVPVLKILLPIMVSSWIGRFAKQSNIYWNWYLRREQRTLNRIQGCIGVDSLETTNPELNQYVTKCEILESHYQTLCKNQNIRPSHYAVLGKKMRLFQKVATKKEVEKLISIAEMIL